MNKIIIIIDFNYKKNKKNLLLLSLLLLLLSLLLQHWPKGTVEWYRECLEGSITLDQSAIQSVLWRGLPLLDHMT